MRIKDTESFKIVANEKTNNLFDYSRVNYKGGREKIEIGCKKHGYFWQTPEYHLYKKQCPKCIKDTLINKDKLKVEYVKKQFSLVHNNRYDYSKFTEDNYVNTSTKVPIGCSIHGEFWQSPATHKKGVGCPKCIKNYKDKDKFIEDVKIRNIKNLCFDKVDYKNSYTDVILKCTLHNEEFKQRPDNLLNSKRVRCFKCNGFRRNTPDVLKERLSELYKDSIYEFYTNNQVLPGVSSSRKQMWSCQKLKNRISMAIEFESLEDLIENLKSTFHTASYEDDI